MITHYIRFDFLCDHLMEEDENGDRYKCEAGFMVEDFGSCQKAYAIQQARKEGWSIGKKTLIGKAVLCPEHKGKRE